MNRIVAVAMTVVFCASFSSTVFATSVVHAYTLTSTEKAEFASSGANIAPFWTADWAGRDSILLNPANATYTGGDGFFGPNDAQLSIKAVGDASGLYLCMVAEDDTFIDPSGDNWYQDCCDFCIDSLSAEQIQAGGKAFSVGPQMEYPFAVTPSSQQFQIWLGATQIPTSLMRSAYVPVAESYENPWVSATISIQDLPSQFSGMSVKIFAVDATHRGLEMFMPWGALGVAGLQTGDVLAGRSFAFSGGYNDVDEASSQQTDVKRLRWNNYDPFVKNWGNAVSAWGDIVMPSDMPAVNSSTAVKSAVSRSLVSNGNVLRSELYDLQGKKIANGVRSRSAGLVVTRSLLSNGADISRIAITNKN